jgi:acyl-CoA dehydrogenase
MQFGLTSEQQLLVDSVRQFVDAELMPYEEEVERTDQVRPELIRQIHERALKAGFYAANMPEELGGGGLDHVALALMERELGRTSMALQYAVARPSNILRACKGSQVERYLLPAIRGERVECLAIPSPMPVPTCAR